ncbi:hypothetical protein CHN50_00210 [Priestia aryabhattai]|uniref:hypothetical protein n=1 Tax=Bacillaceae TaxID=186817 RepID=UPI000BA052C3|nr:MULTISPECIES: hypothetical protein [Bacillaceae]MDT2047400.1 hypothetical protein [Priestia flexa]OZT14050.1 hypothetical protein CHN50_00210 [Priestia aryabhattai]TDB55144.1 hypothetical protein EPL02_02795 [Bacillus sp. CBEL-1]USY56476.1 hypothetical protein NIZ91_07425 [Bacillus sp. 1780r2a1]
MVRPNEHFLIIRQALENSYQHMQQGGELSPDLMNQFEQAKAEYEAALNFISSTDSCFRPLS